MTEILRVLTEAEWTAAQARGVIEPNPLDQRDGFLHLSSPETVLGVVERYFAAHPHVVIVSFDAARLGGAVRWAKVYPDQPAYPHVYLPRLPLSESRRIRRMERTASGLAWATP